MNPVKASLIDDATRDGLRGYKCYTAILDAELTSMSEGPLVVGYRYMIYTLGDGDNFTNVGYVEPNVSFVATGTTPTTWSNSTSVYDFTLSKITPTILENTIGEIVYSVDDYTNHLATLTGAFTENKTHIFITQKEILTDGNFRGFFIAGKWVDVNTIKIIPFINKTTTGEESLHCFIEIRVYP